MRRNSPIRIASILLLIVPAVLFWAYLNAPGVPGPDLTVEIEGTLQDWRRVDARQWPDSRTSYSLLLRLTEHRPEFRVTNAVFENAPVDFARLSSRERPGSHLRLTVASEEWDRLRNGGGWVSVFAIAGKDETYLPIDRSREALAANRRYFLWGAWLFSIADLVLAAALFRVKFAPRRKSGP